MSRAGRVHHQNCVCVSVSYVRTYTQEYKHKHKWHTVLVFSFVSLSSFPCSLFGSVRSSASPFLMNFLLMPPLFLSPRSFLPLLSKSYNSKTTDLTFLGGLHFGSQSFSICVSNFVFLSYGFYVESNICMTNCLLLLVLPLWCVYMLVAITFCSGNSLLM